MTGGKEIKALILLSGGLDSMLAAKFLMENGIKTQGLAFTSFFFNAEAAKKAAQKMNLPLKVIDFSTDHLQIVKKPNYGYGSALNPCIDCHLLMIKTAGEIMRKEGYDFIATGEVLGERPMSQNKKSLNLIARESGLSDRLFRPLSAKLLPETIVQKEGWINPENLLGISGRSRKEQLLLAKRYGIQDFPNPGGGCLLTEKLYAKKAGALLDLCSAPDKNDFDLLRFGRHFVYNGAKIIISRSQIDGEKILQLGKIGDLLIEMADIPGPLALIRKYTSIPDEQHLIEAQRLIRYYSNKVGKDPVFFHHERL